MSGCVIIPFKGEKFNISARQSRDLNRTKPDFAASLPKILSLGEADLTEVCEMIDSVEIELSAALAHYTPPESPERVCQNIAMLYAFAVKVCPNLLPFPSGW